MAADKDRGEHEPRDKLTSYKLKVRVGNFSLSRTLYVWRRCRSFIVQAKTRAERCFRRQPVSPVADPGLIIPVDNLSYLGSQCEHKTVSFSLNLLLLVFVFVHRNLFTSKKKTDPFPRLNSPDKPLFFSLPHHICLTLSLTKASAGLRISTASPPLTTQPQPHLQPQPKCTLLRSYGKLLLLPLPPELP